MPGPLLGRDLWFDSCKRPPAVSDHQVFTFWVVAYGRVTTVVSNLYKCPCSRLGPKFAYSLYGVFVGLLRQSISRTYSDEETGSYHVIRNTKASRNNERPWDYARTYRSQKRTVRASDLQFTSLGKPGWKATFILMPRFWWEMVLATRSVDWEVQRTLHAQRLW